MGCIPTKALIQTADVYHKVKDAARFAVTGVEADKIAVDMPPCRPERKPWSKPWSTASRACSGAIR